MPDEKLGSLADTALLRTKDTDALAPTVARVLSFENHLICWLLEECSPPAAWVVEDYFAPIIVPCFFQAFLRYLCPAPPVSPGLLMSCVSALQSVLTLSHERGELGWGVLSLMPHLHACWRQHLSVVLLRRAAQGVRKNLLEGGTLLCPTSVPVSAMSSPFGEASMAGDGAGRFPSAPHLRLAVEDRAGAWAATPVSFVLQEGAAGGI